MVNSANPQGSEADERALDVGPPMCTRALTRMVDDDVHFVYVKMSAPLQWKRSPPLWVCFWHITKVDMEKARSSFGADAFQALQMALQEIRGFLDKTSGVFFWESPLNGTGFPRSVPPFPPKLSKHCERLIDSEMERFLASSPTSIEEIGEKYLKARRGGADEVVITDELIEAEVKRIKDEAKSLRTARPHGPATRLPEFKGWDTDGKPVGVL